MRRWRALAVVVAAGLVAAGCTAGHRSPLMIGAVYPTTGAQGPGGLEEYRGARLAVDLANSRGGLGGRRVRLVLEDAERSDEAPAAVHRLHRQGAQVVIGSYASVVSAPASEAAARDGMLFWETGAVGETAAGAGAGTRFFRAAPTGATLGRAAVAFIRDELAAKLPAPGHPLRYAVAYVDDAYGRSVGLGALDEARRSGQAVAGTFPYDPFHADYAAVVAQIAASHPDVLFVSAYLQDGVALRRAMLAAHLPLLASIGTSSSYCLPAFADQLGHGAVGLFAADKPDAHNLRRDALTGEGRRLLDWAEPRHQRRYGAPMSAAALAGFANTWALLGHVIPAAGDASPAAIARAGLSVRLPAGTLANGSGVDFAPPGSVDAGSNRRAASVIWEWVAERQHAVVWPPAFATHPIDAMAIDR